MAGGCAWSRRGAARAKALRGLMRETQKALQDVAQMLSSEPEITASVLELSTQSARPTVLVVWGTSQAATARLVHCLLGQKILPVPLPRRRRWIRIQYGSAAQVHMTLGNSEFELVEELESNKSPWDTIPLQDLLRTDQADLTTILEVQLNNQFLKDGLRILIPPDIDSPPDPKNTTIKQLKELYSDFYTKRDLILKNFNPVHLYALDRIGKNIFEDRNICDSKMAISRSEEDFWATFNMYYMTRTGNDGGKGETGDVGEVRDVGKCLGKGEERVGEGGRPCVFDVENCLNLHQVKELCPHAQLFFVLFSDSVDVSNRERPREESSYTSEATESAEDFRTDELPESDRQTEESQVKSALKMRRHQEEQCAFMNELLDRWELMSGVPPKHSAKSQHLIVDDEPPPTSPPLTPRGGRPGQARGRGEGGGGGRVSRGVLVGRVVRFAADVLQGRQLELCTKLSEIHVKLLQKFILASFDLARELQVVPKKIQYVAIQEQQLYETIIEKFSEGDKKQELLQIMQEVLEEMKTEVNIMDWSVDDLPCHQDTRFIVSNSTFYSSPSMSRETIRLLDRSCIDETTTESGLLESSEMQGSDAEEAVSYDSYNFDDYEIIEKSDSLPLSTNRYWDRVHSPVNLEESHASQHIPVENESSVLSVNMSSTLFDNSSYGTSCTNTIQMSVKQASLDVQKTVLTKLSRKISMKLVNFVDCLKDTYFGTLQRCLESLESSCRQQLGGRPVSAAMRALVSAARGVDLTPCAGFSVLRSLAHSLRRLWARLRITGDPEGASCCVLSPVWRREVATQTVCALTPTRLHSIISKQILDRLSTAHERYQSALTSLETALTSKLHVSEDVKLAIRKKYAPGFARLCLESTSMCDLLMYGTPELGREIGRGQYGVVYAVRGSWAGQSPLAVKSVLPTDERHYRDLAMEFFYTRSIPPHPRVVQLRGSVVTRAAPAPPSVLLLTARYSRDLHSAVRAGLSLATRLCIARDIVEGIRYLHSLGLVHRDIKMKNVLLDSNNRAALSDFGFCAAEALMSGSVVGTPVHMAPELLQGGYDASVDVYAFGILFWYICAGSVKLPAAFEGFQNKEQLWGKVQRGLRPERLPQFYDECWEIMESCWNPDPAQRALLGDVQPKLDRIWEHVLRNEGSTKTGNVANILSSSEEDSLYMTGLEKFDAFL